MKFRAHETFFIRKGWLYKGLKRVNDDPAVFMGAKGNPMDILGIGANMVKSLRYWLQAVGLTSESSAGPRTQQITEFGRLVYDYDKYMEEIGTLWLLHYKLVTNRDYATSWYFFFNEFRLMEFTRDDFIIQLKNYIRNNGDDSLENSKKADRSERSLEEDFNCLINTYVPRLKSNPGKVHPENNIDCPLGELLLVDIVNVKDKSINKLYKKTTPSKETIDPLILLAVILDNLKDGQVEIKISSLLNDRCNVGKVFNLDTITLINLLNGIEHFGFIKVIRTAGLDVVRIEKDMTFLECIENYYNAING